MDEEREKRRGIALELANLYGYESGLAHNEFEINELREENTKLKEGTLVDELKARIEVLEDAAYASSEFVASWYSTPEIDSLKTITQWLRAGEARDKLKEAGFDVQELFKLQ